MNAATDTSNLTSETNGDAQTGTQNPEAKPLLLPSLEIKNFRAFSHLTIEKLGRVNLITGKNNVGKTSLLEALWLYAEDGSLQTVQDILAGRDELEEKLQFQPVTEEFQRNPNAASDVVSIVPTRKVVFSFAEATLPYIESLFNAANTSEFFIGALTIGEIANSNNNLTVTLVWGKTFVDLYRNERVTLFTENEVSENIIEMKPFLSIDKDRKGVRGFSFEQSGFHWRRAASNHSIFIASQGLSADERSRFWDDVNLTEGKQELLLSLKILAPQIIDFAFRESKYTKDRRIPFVRQPGFKNVIPLKSLGQGMIKVLDIALGLINQAGGILLIDEIENGLHYSVLPDVWRLIFQTARRLNVQVFATTHSWDCIEAFQEAAGEDTDPESRVLVRLQNDNGIINSVVIDERNLRIVTRDGIEVR